MTNSLRLFKPMAISIATLVFVSSSLLTVSVHAHEHTEEVNIVKKTKNHQASSFKKYLKRLNLTEEQKLKLTDIRAETKSELALYKDDMKAYKAAKKTLLESDELDESSLTDLYAQYQSTFSAVELIKTKRMFALKQVLTEEQFTKLKKMIKKGKKVRKEKIKLKRKATE